MDLGWAIKISNIQKWMRINESLGTSDKSD